MAGVRGSFEEGFFRGVVYEGKLVLRQWTPSVNEREMRRRYGEVPKTGL